jgi:putative Mn2+ efflux pump MntP
MDSIFSIILIAIGLSMDSFAVSLSNGISIAKLNLSQILLIAFFLAFFQAFMPVLGWLSGNEIEGFIKEFDHWIAFSLLFFIGGKMIYEGWFEESSKKVNVFRFSTLIVQSVATSIDAFAVGLSFAFLDINISKSALIIGVVTFIFSLTGLYIGKSIGNKIGSKSEILGGLILIGIGTKILLEHLFFV